MVFYNGEEEQEAESELRLSQSFKQKTDKPELELIVKVLNINLDKNQDVLNTCQLLKEYMLMIDKTGGKKNEKSEEKGEKLQSRLV